MKFNKKVTTKNFQRLFLAGLLTFLSSSQAADYYVSTDGSDDNAGSKSAPFKTIQKAASILKPGDKCIIRGGRYHETIKIENINAAEEKPIIFTAFAGEKVTLDGSVPITSKWTKYKTGIYKTKLDHDIWQLFAGGKSMSSARWPNGNWIDGSLWDSQNSMAWPEKERSEFGHHYNEGLKKLDFSLADGGFIVVGSGSFKTYKSPIIDHKAGSDNFVYDTNGVHQHTMGFTVDRHLYFLEGKLGLLDTPGEWFYEPSDKTLYLWPLDNASPDRLDIKGKVQSYAFDLSNSSHIQIRGLNFFGTTFQAIDCSNITIEDCGFLYPSYSKRMLHDLSEMDVTKMLVAEEFTPAYNKVINCKFEYADGPALEMNGLGNTIENCYMHDIDYSCTYKGGYTLNMIDSPELTFRRNTIHTTGPSELFKAGIRNLIELNDLSRSGYFQNDGSMIQVSVKQQDRNVTHYNWIHDSVKQGFRFDNSNKPNSPWGENGRAHHNVAWNVGRQFIKGDKHFIHNNLCFDCEKNDLSISSKIEIQGRNFSTITRNNIAGMLSGDINKPLKDSPLPGIASHNWTGLERKAEVRTQLRDPDNFDFRPKADSELVDAGSTEVGIKLDYLGDAPDIGPYEYGDKNYWIAGRQGPRASVPIPPDGTTTAKIDADLMWLKAYKTELHDVYFGSSEKAVSAATKKSKEYKASQTSNIFDPAAGNLEHGKTYYWRIDAVKNGNVIKGNVWSFTTE
jgi:hypothetical protein